MKELYEDYSKDQVKIRLILSNNCLYGFEKWKEFQQIVKIASPLIGTREEYIEKVPKQIIKVMQNNFVKTKIIDVSATNIRKRIKNNLFCEHLVCKDVLNFIEKHNLYK